jgi:hypothetical protein
MPSKELQGMPRTHTASNLCYTPVRLEWHLGDESTMNPAGYCVVLQGSKRDFCRFNRLAAALAKSQDHRASCGVFAFGQHNAVRRWLCLRYPITRANQSGERGRIFRAWRLKQSEVMRCDDLAPKSRHLKHRANFVYEHGKAMLCSNLHQKALLNTRGKR